MRDALRAEAAPVPPQHHTFKTSLVQAMLTQHWDKDKQPDGKTTKVNPDALKLAAEYLRLFVIDAYKRATFEARMDNEEIVSSMPFICTTSRIACCSAAACKA
eukprot:16321-Heterococcus_DN1.PRE.1